MNTSFLEQVEMICERDQRYKVDAYGFLLEALHYAQKRFKSPRHVTGEELVEALREFSVKKFGPLAINVLQHWGVRTAEDFGNIVFNMVEARIIAKQEHDTIDSFRNSPDFGESLSRGYRSELKKTISRMR